MTVAYTSWRARLVGREGARHARGVPGRRQLHPARPRPRPRGGDPRLFAHGAGPSARRHKSPRIPGSTWRRDGCGARASAPAMSSRCSQPIALQAPSSDNGDELGFDPAAEPAVYARRSRHSWNAAKAKILLTPPLYFGGLYEKSAEGCGSRR